ncbi:hypothetical protein KCU71_g163, partial [Aureobasidium melanogenum]
MDLFNFVPSMVTRLTNIQVVHNRFPNENDSRCDRTAERDHDSTNTQTSNPLMETGVCIPKPTEVPRNGIPKAANTAGSLFCSSSARGSSIVSFCKAFSKVQRMFKE